MRRPLWGSGPSLDILRYGVSATFPPPPKERDCTARGRVRPGGPYGWVGSCSACPAQVLYGSAGVAADAIRRHLRKVHW